MVLKYFNVCPIWWTKRFYRIYCVLILIAIPLFPIQADEIAFFYALDSDWASFRKDTDLDVKSVRVGSRNILILSVGSHRVYAAKMGAGCVETAVTAQAVLAKYRCDYAISVGPVGAIDGTRRIGDWAAVEKVTAYQRGTESKNGFRLAAKGDLSLKSADSIAKLWIPKEIKEQRPMHAASGEIFSASNAFRSKLSQSTNADVIDMNLFGLLTVCQDHDVPVIAWRVVSDRADERALEDFNSFVKAYRGNGGTWALEWVKRLPKNPAHADSYEGLRSLLK